MKKTLQTKEIMKIYSDLEEFVKKDINLPAQFAWNLEDNSEALKAVVEKFERWREKIIQPFREKDAFTVLSDDQIQVQTPYIDDFQKALKEIEEYMTTENEIEIKTVCKSIIPDSISVKDLRAIRFMIDEE